MFSGGITMVFVSDVTVNKGAAQLLAPWNMAYSFFVLLGTSPDPNVTLIMTQGGPLSGLVSQLKTSGIETSSKPVRIIRKKFFFTMAFLR